MPDQNGASPLWRWSRNRASPRNPVGSPIKSGALAENTTAIGTLPKKGMDEARRLAGPRGGLEENQGWIVRKKMKPGEATKPGFARELFQNISRGLPAAEIHHHPVTANRAREKP